MLIKSNEKGFTLIELLATLALVGILGTIIWNFFFYSITYQEAEISNYQLQREGNIILNDIQKLHTTSKITNIESNNNSLKILKDEEILSEYHNENIHYEVEYKKISDQIFTFTLTLTPADAKSKSREFKTTTTFSKLK